RRVRDQKIAFPVHFKPTRRHCLHFPSGENTLSRTSLRASSRREIFPSRQSVYGERLSTEPCLQDGAKSALALPQADPPAQDGPRYRHVVVASPPSQSRQKARRRHTTQQAEQEQRPARPVRLPILLRHLSSFQCVYSFWIVKTPVLIDL